MAHETALLATLTLAIAFGPATPGWLPADVGLALSVASTVVVLRTLEARGRLGTVGGRAAVGCDEHRAEQTLRALQLRDVA